MKIAISITALVAATCWLPTMVYAADMSTNQPSTTDKAKQNVSDAAITAKVKAALAIEKNVSATRISVDTDNNGVVTLRGPVRSQTEADRAVEVARGIEGVKSVTNQLQVSATTTSATPDTSSRNVESSGTANRTAASERPSRRDRN